MTELQTPEVADARVYVPELNSSYIRSVKKELEEELADHRHTQLCPTFVIIDQSTRHCRLVCDLDRLVYSSHLCYGLVDGIKN